MWLLGAVCSYAAAEGAVKFSTIGCRDGLSQLSVLDICQDSKGVMWFATRNGLNRFDGERFDVYKYHYADSSSLSGSSITVLHSDPAHEGLWVGTVNGLNYMDLRTNRFVRYLQSEYAALPSNNILSLCIDGKGRVWIGTMLGLVVYGWDNGTIEAPELPEELRGTAVESLCCDRKGNLYIGTRGKGMYRIRAEGKEAKAENGPAGIPEQSTVSCIFEDSYGQLWIGTAAGLYKWSADRKRLDCFKQMPGGLSNDNIRCMGEQNGRLIVGTFDGLSVVNLDDDSVTLYNGTSSTGRGLNHFSVRSLFIDRAGTLWVGTWSGGVNYYNPLNHRFEFEALHEPGQMPSVLGESVYSDGLLWIASEGEGLIAWNPETRQTNRYLLRPNEATQNHNIIKSMELHGRDIWCGTNDGCLYRFNLDNRHFTLEKRLDANRGIHAIHHDAQGHIWLCTTYRHGLTEVLPDGTERDHTPIGVSVVNFSSARALAEVSDGIFLIGTRSSGLFEYDTRRKQVVRYAEEEKGRFRHIDSNQITQVLSRKHGEVWIATQGAGIYEYRYRRGLVRHVSKQDGLPGEDIYSMADTGQEIWLTTDQYVAVLHPLEGVVRSFPCFADTEVMEFTPQGGICMPNGEVCFSGNSGLLRFDPGKMIYNQSKPDIVLDALSVNNRRIVPVPGKGILHEVLDDTPDITLRYDENNFSISYCALNYLQHRRNRYAYLLEGHDHDWNEAGNRKEAFYTNIPPGHYVFRVKACNNDGIWNEEGRSIGITVLSPWWKTPWAYLLYVLVAAGIAYLIVHHWLREHKLEYDLKLHEELRLRNEELQATKNRLFTTFSHELRTPLTLVISPLEELLRRAELSKTTREELALILRNANRMLLLVNQLMDLQKNESGCLELHARHQGLTSFLQEMYYAFRYVAEQRRIDFRFEVPAGEVEAVFDEGLLEKAVFNLLGNAFKYTAPGEEIRLGLQVREEGFFIEVSDTGQGIAPADREHIFELFYQSGGNKPVSAEAGGTGIGLSLTKSIAELHGGSISMEGNTPKGSRFTLFIPRLECPEEEALSDVMPSDGTSGEEDLPFVEGKTVLLVEDNKDIRSYLRKRLEKHYRIVEAHDGKEAFETVKRELPDLVISDIMMPVMDGLELCQCIKADLNTGHIPVMLLTARILLPQIKEGYLTGADDYVVKPFNMDVLRTRIYNLLSQREKLKKLYGKSFSPQSMGFDTTSADEHFMQKLFDVIGQHLTSAELGTDLICRELGMSRSNFYRKVKSVTELSLNDLIRHKRLEVAASLLKTRTKSISEVADVTGFSSATYFAKCFKDEFGMSPSAWLKENS